MGEQQSDKHDDMNAGERYFNAREEFALSCMNAAVHLYGVLTFAEMAEVYNHYAKNHDAPVSDSMTADEMGDLADDIFERLSADGMVAGPAQDYDYWYSTWKDYRTGERLLVSESLTASSYDFDGTPRTPEERAKLQEEENDDIDRCVARLRDSFFDVDMALLPERDFLDYESLVFCEDTQAARDLAAFIQREYFEDEASASEDVADIANDLNKSGAMIANALDYIRDQFFWWPSDEAGYIRLVRAIGPLTSVVRTWEYRGHNAQELVEMGIIDKRLEEEVPEFSEFGDSSDGAVPDYARYDGESSYVDDCADDDDGAPVRLEELPPAKLTGPFDFKSVKDAKVRDKLLFDYEGARIVTQDFVRRIVMHEMTQEERRAAARRLGFEIDDETGFLLDRNLDMVAGDFGSMMDDQHGEPAIRRVLKRKDSLENELDRAAAEYYENYRYTWLEVMAVKVGLGVKCRDLMTGEDLFLMETRLSQCDVKGMTICAGIAPMGEVYFVLGVLHPADFENPSMVLKVVLSHLGLPTAIPVSLSFADQSRFAAETIRRIHANGRFDGADYG